MRSTLALALAICAAAPVTAAAQEVVDGFHGYRWGTHGRGIAEIVDQPRVGDKDGLHIHSAELPFLGREVLAGFYLHPETGRLVEGAYVFHVGLEECQATWDRALRELEGRFPTLRRTVEKTSRTGKERQVYPDDCEHYVFNYRPGDPDWRAEMVAPGGPDEGRVLVRLQAVGRSLRMTVLYQGAAARAWADRNTGR